MLATLRLLIAASDPEPLCPAAGMVEVAGYSADSDTLLRLARRHAQPACSLLRRCSA